MGWSYAYTGNYSNGKMQGEDMIAISQMATITQQLLKTDSAPVITKYPLMGIVAMKREKTFVVNTT